MRTSTRSPCASRMHGVYRGTAHVRTCASQAHLELASRQVSNESSTSSALAAALSWDVLPVPGLTTDRRSFVEFHRIRSHEVGPSRRSSLMTISNMLQEAASNHIVTLRGRSSEGFAADPQLVELGLIFVLTRMQIRMRKYPFWGDVVKTESYFQQEGRIRARRDWTLTDVRTGEQLGCATSSWVLLNVNTRRLAKMPEEVADSYADLMESPDRRVIPEQEAKLKLPEMPEGGALRERLHQAFRADMDMNDHVNNTAYISWLLETVPEDVHDHGHLAQYEVDYKNECFAGNLMTVQSAAVDDAIIYDGLDGNVSQYLHTVRLGDSEIVRARTTWTQ